jgi:hypothetical protein
MAEKQTVGSVTYQNADQTYFDKRGLKRHARVWSLGLLVSMQSFRDSFPVGTWVLVAAGSATCSGRQSSSPSCISGWYFRW